MNFVFWHINYKELVFIGLDSNRLNQIQKYQLVFARIRNISNYLGDAIGRKLFMTGFSEKYVQDYGARHKNIDWKLHTYLDCEDLDPEKILTHEDPSIHTYIGAC